MAEQKKFFLVTGGSASGKSEFAEELIVRLRSNRPTLDKSSIYVATMQPFGEEALARVAKHRQQRQQRSFETKEIYTDLQQLHTNERESILLECMSNLVANELFSEQRALDDDFLTEVEEKIVEAVRKIKSECGVLVVVTNEVFSDTMNYPEETMKYIGALGHINTELAKEADEVVEVVYGIPLYIKK